MYCPDLGGTGPLQRALSFLGGGHSVDNLDNLDNLDKLKSGIEIPIRNQDCQLIWNQL